MHGTTKVEARSFALGRIFERTTQLIEDAAAELGAAEQDLTQELGTILLLGTQERAKDTVRVQPLRVQAPRVDKGVRKVEGRGGARKGSPRKKVSAIKAYWAAMTKEERSAEMQRRMRVHQRNTKEVA